MSSYLLTGWIENLSLRLVLPRLARLLQVVKLVKEHPTLRIKCRLNNLLMLQFCCAGIQTSIDAISVARILLHVIHSLLHLQMAITQLSHIVLGGSVLADRTSVAFLLIVDGVAVGLFVATHLLHLVA